MKLQDFVVMVHYIRYIKQTSSQRSLNAVRALCWVSRGKMRRRNQNFPLFFSWDDG